MYVRMPRPPAAKPHPVREISRLFEHIQLQVERSPWVVDLDRMVGMPAEVLAIYWVWRFICEAGGNGIEKVLLDFTGYEIKQAHAALVRIGAHEFVRRLEIGIPLAIEAGCAEFQVEPDLEWFVQFAADAKFPTLHSIDKDTPRACYRELDEMVLRYIHEHASVFYSEAVT